MQAVRPTVQCVGERESEIVRERERARERERGGEREREGERRKAGVPDVSTGG